MLAYPTDKAASSELPMLMNVHEKGIGCIGIRNEWSILELIFFLIVPGLDELMSCIATWSLVAASTDP